MYGATYALPLGTDPEVMAKEIGNPTTTWLVAREHGKIVASIMGTVEPADRMGKLQGLVVDPEHRGGGIAHHAVGRLADVMLADGDVDSVYGTARTTATAPQRICLRNGFHALGIFPNLRKAERHETMALLARYRDGVLENRHPVHKAPASLGPLLRTVHETVGLPEFPELVPETETTSAESSGPIELIDAPQFVLRHFESTMIDPVRRFYPLHKPNVLLAAAGGEYQVYAHLSRKDGYCTLIGATPSPHDVAPHLDKLIDELNGFGAFYIETLVPLYSFHELSTFLGHGFLPVAMYPGMRRDGDAWHDYVVMARTMQPLDFRGLQIDAAFRPFAEQYIDLWTQKFLNTNGVFR
ncbi:GNAT family N-acetyltransferase [Lentzea sp. NBRC 105346]|uniref:GNAT family N-acetyltransferase n=1 Tax=Lentzea sp. NBRC 105346 TaxID=3032205 RepID=UPI0025557EA3|nr:GNAT family N-acetyltransferase [Lentzea sp. NBRC 105346]